MCIRDSVNAVSVCCVICCGLFLILATRQPKDVAVLLILGFQSMVCSCVTLRYHFQHEYNIPKFIKFRITNRRITYINWILLILIFWLSVAEHGTEYYLMFFFQLPLVFFIVSTLMKKWILDMENEVSQLHNMKYKYKNV